MTESQHLYTVEDDDEFVNVQIFMDLIDKRCGWETQD